MEFDKLRDDVITLRQRRGAIPGYEAVNIVARLLTPLLSAEGLKLFEPNPGHMVDLLAGWPNGGGYTTTVGIEYADGGGDQPIAVDALRHLVGTISSSSYERVMLISPFGFTRAARQEARRLAPVTIELLDLDSVEAWIRRVEVGKPTSAAQIELLIKSLSHQFAEMVAADPGALDHLEWRDLERMVARVLEGLGFETVLTAPSKDGGKDLVLVCEAARGTESFVVELKHWRSGKRVGRNAVSDFMRVIIAEKRSGGLFLSTSGYAADAFEGITEVSRSRLRLGGRAKIVLLARTYTRACQGLWSPPALLPEVLFEATE